jgi:hypothetical protein
MNDLTLEQLNDGLQSPFWRWFSLQYQKEWGEAAFGLRVAAILRVKPYDVAAPLIQQVTVARQEMDKLFSMPKEKLESLQSEKRREDAGVQPGRRPIGL